MMLACAAFVFKTRKKHTEEEKRRNRAQNRVWSAIEDENRRKKEKKLWRVERASAAHTHTHIRSPPAGVLSFSVQWGFELCISWETRGKPQPRASHFPRCFPSTHRAQLFSSIISLVELSARIRYVTRSPALRALPSWWFKTFSR